MAERTASPTIMVVDDTPENLTVLTDMLQGKHYRVQAFPGGAMALKAAQVRPPDLILLDIMMPEMNGFEVCERLKADAALKDIPVLFVSALSETTDKLHAFAVGGMDYVTKPFQIEEVHARVQAHIELRRQRRELKEAYDKLRKLEALRDDLTHMIVHDMRSPLTVVDGAYEIVLMEKDRLSPTQQEFVAMGQNSCRVLINMVSSLLDISRMESGQMPLNRVPHDLRDLAREAVESVAVLAQEKALTVRVSGDSARVSVAPDLMHRVLVNLLGNAIKYSPNGGTIGVHVSHDEQVARATVSDQGRGIPPEYHEKVFEKFGQVESRKGGQRHSSGLGLTFCKLAVEAHGGTIGVESPSASLSAGEVGKGSTFWFTLPRAVTG